MRDLKYVVTIDAFDSDEEIWAAYPSLEGRLQIRKVLFGAKDGPNQIIESNPDDYYESPELVNQEIMKIFSGKSDSHKLNRVYVTADGSVSVNILDCEMGMEVSYLINENSKPKFEIVAYNHIGRVEGIYLVDHCAWETSITEARGKLYGIKPWSSSRKIVLKTTDPYQLFITESC